MTSRHSHGNSMQLVPVVPSGGRAVRYTSSQDAPPAPGSLQELSQQLDKWQPFQNGHPDPTWQEFMREQAKVEQDMLEIERQMGFENNNTLRSNNLEWPVADPGTSNGVGTLDRNSKDLQPAGAYGGREVMTWPSPVIKQHHNGLTSFQLDVDVGDTYRPEEIHVNIVDGHMLHIHAQHRYLRRQVKDNMVSDSRQLSEFDRRFALPDHTVRPENLTCLVSPEGILHIRGFLGDQIVQHRLAVTPDSTDGKKGSKTKRRKVNFAVFGSKKK